MNDTNPILLLMVGLLALANSILWWLSIYVAAVLARRAGRRRWPWVLLAVLSGFINGGTAYLGIGYLAHSYRRNVPAWVVVQIIVFICVAVAAFGPLMPVLVTASPLLGLALLLGMVVAAAGPIIVLGSLGPRRVRAGDEEPEVIIRAARLKKSYDLGRQKLRVLRGVSLSVKRGEFLAILGTSGSGKSTLLHLLGLLDRADTGSVTIEGADSAELTGPQRDRIRCRDIGFVFQFYHLLPELNVVQNVLMPSMAATGAIGWIGAGAEARRRAVDILERLGLSDRLKHRPRQLSGGEQQRVAIGRGLVNRPRILLADEPTGNLDSNTGQEIITLLKKLNTETGQTIVMVTHDERLAQQADRVLHLRDGRLR